MKLKRLDLLNLHSTLEKNELQCLADVLEDNDFNPVPLLDKSRNEEENSDQLPPSWVELVKGNRTYTYTREEIEIIEQKTRQQSKSDIWHRYRKGLITASHAHRVFTWVFSCWTKDGDHDPTSLLKSITGKQIMQTAAMKRGLALESSAKAAFVQQNQSC